MSSPFATTKEFMEAKGPIYTFANNSTVSTLFLLMSLAITIYFFYASYAMHKKEKSSASTSHLMSLFLVAGLAVPLVNTLLGTPKQPPTTTSQRPEVRRQIETKPVALLLGLMSGTGAAVGRQFGRKQAGMRMRRRR
jgi:hypothetical protein